MNTVWLCEECESDQRWVFDDLDLLKKFSKQYFNKSINSYKGKRVLDIYPACIITPIVTNLYHIAEDMEEEEI